MSQVNADAENKGVPGQTVNVPTPDSGASISVESSPGGALHLDFDPSTATTSRDGNSLVFEVDGGGTVTVTDFFVVGDQSLPSLVLPDGTEIASADFFEGSDLDMSTAAGPAAGPPPGGGTSYNDDPGNLMGGVDKFGKLGTDYWGRDTDPTLEDRGQVRPGELERPGGIFGLSGNSYDMNGMFVQSGMYEDWKPNKHEGDQSMLLGKLDFNFQPTGTTVVDGIHLSGFHPGTIIVIGTPQFDADGNLTNGVTVTSPNQVLTFSRANFDNAGVYVKPPPYSDEDMNIRVRVDVHAESSGIRGSVEGNFTIIVDAVADQPFVKDAVFDDMNLSGHVDVGEGNKVRDDEQDGQRRVSEHEMSGKEEVSITVPFSTTVIFEDYQDGSESHFVLVEVPSVPAGAEWSCMDANGNPVGMITGPDGTTYFQIPVDNADIADGNGEVAVNVNLTVKGDSDTVVDTDMKLKTGAMADEGAGTDGELRLDNNQSFAINDEGVAFRLDTVDGGLRVTAGWASEGNNDSKHIGGEHGEYKFAGAEDGATGSTGAPITIEVGVGASGAAESITSVTFTYDASEGYLYHNGQPLVPDANGKVTLTVDPPSSKIDLEYRPNEGSFSDKDVNIHYKVEVRNDAGVTGSYQGNVTVVVDAVADQPVDLGVTAPGYAYEGEGGYSAATSGSLINFTVSASFPDTQGSENHFLLVQVPSPGSNLILCDAGGNPISYDTTVINGETFYKIPAGSTESPVSADVHFKVGDRGDAQDGTHSIKTGALAEVIEDADRMDSEHDRGNNQAHVINDTSVDIRVDYLDTDASSKAKDMYEDNMSQQHLGNYTQDKGLGIISINLNTLGDDNTVLNSDVTITFSYDGNAPAEGLHFSVNGHDLYAQYNEDTGKFDLTVPQDYLDAKTGGQIQYHPPANDDTDLTNLGYSLDVKNLATGENGHIDGNVAGERGGSTLIVDAVADKPTDISAGDVSYAKGTDEDGNPKGQESATWGSQINFNANATFHDIVDGSETHYVLVQKLDGWSGDYPTVSYGTPAVNYYYIDVNGAINEALAQGPGTYDLGGIIVTIGTGPGGQPQAGVSVDFDLTLPDKGGTGNYNYMAGDGSVTIKTGGLAIEGKIEGGKIKLEGSDKEITTANNVSDTLVNVAVEINVVTSDPKISITGNAIYENLTPNAHKGDETRSEGAKITVSNVHEGETATITFNFDFQKGGAGPDSFTSKGSYGDPDSPQYDVMRLEVHDADGNVVATYPINWDGNSWSCTVEVEGGSDMTYIFKPGYNYNSTDLSIKYDISITDPASGDTIEWKTGDNPNLPELGVLIDAVAQAPDINGTVPGYEYTGGEDAFVSGGKVDLGLKVEFRDFEDGSEVHFVLVEAKVGWNPPASTIIIYDADGQTNDVSVKWEMQMVNGKMYYKAEVPNEAISEHGQTGQHGDGLVDIHIILQSPPGQKADMNFKMGAGSWENKDLLDGEITWDNNTSFVFQDVGISFSSVGNFSLTSKSWVFENDTANAHTGDNTESGGCVLALSVTPGNVVTDFYIDNYDPARGTLTFTGSDGVVRAVVEAPNHPGRYIIEGNPPLTGGETFNYVPSKDYSDVDINIKYGGTITDPRSGDTKGSGGSSDILVDAVAQLPGDVSSDAETSVDWSGPKGEFSFKVSSSFEDFDGSESHYILIQQQPNISLPDAVGTFSVKNPDGTYTNYWKVPIDNSQVGPDGSATVDVRVVVEGDAHTLWRNGLLFDTIKVGALAEEHPSDQELTYHNNWAYKEGGDVNVDWGLGPGHGSGPLIYVTEPGFENDRPNSHLGDENPAGGVLIRMSGSIAEADVSWTGGEGYIVDGDGNKLEPDANGSYHLSRDQGPYRFIPEGHGDEDVNMSYKAKLDDGTEINGKFVIIIDAVANQPQGQETAVDYGGAYTAVGKPDGHGNDGEVTIRVSGEFVDNDGSETHYALVEAQPGYNVPGAEMVYLDGKAFYRVEMAKNPDGTYKEVDGKQYADVVVKVTNPEAIGKGGHNLKTGLMAEEQPTDMEARSDNNVSWVIDGNAHIEVSFVDSTVSVSVPSGVYERSESDPGFEVKLSGNLGEDDKFEGMTISAKGAGTFSVDDPNGVGGWEIVGGKLVITDFTAIGNIKVTFTPDTHSDEDISFSWSAKFTNERSGDVESRGGAPYVIVDAVANAPDIVDHSVASDGGNLAAQVGEGTNVSVTLSFEDMSGREVHYAVLEQGAYTGKSSNVWLCNKALVNGVECEIITVFDQNGKPYYAVQISHEALMAGTPPGTVVVTWHVTAPYADHDVTTHLKVGGIALELNTGTGSNKELTLDNNWAESFQKVPVNIGVFDTKEVNFDARGTLVQYDTDGIALHLQTPADGSNEIITETTLSFSQEGAKEGDVIGTVWYKGEAYEIVADADGNGSMTIDFKPDGYDPAEDFRFTATDADGNSYHNSNPISFESDSTVRDMHLGEERSFTSSQTIQMQAVADAPTDVNATISVDEVGSGGTVTVTITANFVDLDGSENHYVLVEAKEGWTCNEPTGTWDIWTGPDGKDYFRVQVSSTEASVSKEVSLTAPDNYVVGNHPESFATGALAQERAEGSDNSNGFTGSNDLDVSIYDSATLSLVNNNHPGGVAEGDSVSFTLKLADGEQACTANEDISVTLRLTGVDAETATQLPAGWELQSDGSYHITVVLPAGSSTADIEIPVGKDDVLGTTGTGSIQIEVIDANVPDSLQHAVTVPYDAGYTVPIIDGDSASLILTQGASTTITEGNDISFNMELKSSSGNPMTAGQDVTVTFMLSLSATVLFDWEAAAQRGIQHEFNPGGGWLVTVSLPAGESSADITIPTLDVPGFQGSRAVTISEVEVDGGGFSGNINVQAESEFSYTVQDATTYFLEQGESFDGSAATQGLEIYGGDGANEIIGSDHGDIIYAGDGGSIIQGGAGDDTIFAGRGDDIISGGGGNNVFVWENDKFGGSDTITDFSFNHEWNEDGTLTVVDGAVNDKIQISFQDLLGSGEGDSLGALLSGLSASGDGTFSYSADAGGFAVQFSECGTELRLTLHDGNGGTLQTITVQSANQFTENPVDMNAGQAATILQQILTCSSSI